jgi:thiol-disulfide isomerase/thioredoxin
MQTNNTFILTKKLIIITAFLFKFCFVNSQNIVIKYIGSSNESINLSYNYRELSNEYTVLNKNNRYLNIKSNHEETILCDDDKRNTQIFAKPNDTIKIDLNNKGLIIYSSNNSEYRKNESLYINYCFEKYGPIKDLLSKKRWLYSNKKNNSENFLQSNFDNEIKLLDSYYNKKNISIEFYKFFKSSFWSLTTLNKLQNTKTSDTALKEIKSSLSNIKSIDFLLKVPEYRLLLLNYNFELMKKSKSKKDLYSSLIFISKNYSNQSIIDYLLFNKLKFTFLYQKTKIDKNSKTFFKNNCKNIQFVNEVNQDLNPSKENLILSDLIKKFKGKIVFIDFWASWCAPCKDEFPYQQKLMKLYPKIDFIFISIDKSKASWIKATKEYPNMLTTKNSFFIGDIMKDDLLKNINVSSIPRYILIDKNGKIIDRDAPRPSDPKLKILLSKF